MCLAILCYNVTHPGTVLQGPEARLPTIRSLVFKKRRGGKQQVGSGDKGGVEMGSNYVELGRSRLVYMWSLRERIREREGTLLERDSDCGNSRL
jgi:hypothetical protein